MKILNLYRARQQTERYRIRIVTSIPRPSFHEVAASEQRMQADAEALFALLNEALPTGTVFRLRALLMESFKGDDRVPVDAEFPAE